MTLETTARFEFPLLQPGQAQKEMFHNEAITALDILTIPAVESVGENAPPLNPELGAGWIVGAEPSGAWAGKTNALAAWTSGGWRFVTPVNGMQVWSTTDRTVAIFEQGSWQTGDLNLNCLRINQVQVIGAQQEAISDPQDGTTIDQEARTALEAILNALRQHGLIANH